jgi:superfamily II DNA or RNA helicase
MRETKTGLREIRLKPEYNTEEDQIIVDFYSPCLSASERYDRAVGYFRANIYRELGEDLLDFVIRGGKVRIVCSPDIPETDEETAREGYELRGKRSEEEKETALLQILLQMSKNPDEKDCLDMLRLLIEKGSMELYVATRSGGIYHRKIGVFYDRNGDYVAFSGSGNETQRAVSSIEDWGNDEEFDVYRSWGNEFESHKANKKAQYFEKLVQGGTKNTRVRPLNAIEREELARYRNHSTFEDCRSGARRRTLEITQDKDKTKKHAISPYYYQLQAIESWRKNNRIGMLSMATGTGKTYTALLAVSDLIEQGRLIVIIVPSRLLLEQWYETVREFYLGIPVLLAGGGNNWKSNPLKQMFVSDIEKPRIIITTMSTAASDDFIAYLSQAHKPVLIADEAHGIGSPTHRKILQSIQFDGRLGLSATPERLFDDEGNQVIEKYFGENPIYNLPFGGRVKLSKKDDKEVPILGNFLARYNYHFRTVDLTREEQKEWDEMTKEIKTYISTHPEAVQKSDKTSSDTKKLELMLIKRARILKKAQRKTEAAIDIISEKYAPGSRWIVYCEDEEQMNQVAGTIKRERPDVTCIIYHSDMPDDERERTLLFFERNPSIIVSIRCLDEGVDIPTVDGALILASSTNPRQYIQRRGRVLRKAKGKRLATIIDVLVLPEAKDTDLLPIVRGELSRAWNFAKNAENSEITHELWKICMMYGVDVAMDEQIGLNEENGGE